ncbi:putative methylthioribulose-1-phosphate dehydratase, class II aldolase/adducin domain superfamily [Helianthus annuus]|nr:putative methylthioribulose-1-phosphate dehydratase, class II aldolase/adducin domain superfamily [Helianthus annuus]
MAADGVTTAVTSQAYLEGSQVKQTKSLITELCRLSTPSVGSPAPAEASPPRSMTIPSQNPTNSSSCSPPITHMEMIKGIQGHGYYDELVVTIIENTAHERELT